MNASRVGDVVTTEQSRRGAAAGSCDVVFRAFRGPEGLDQIRSDWEVVVNGLSRKRFHHFHCWHHAYVHELTRDRAAHVYFVAYRDNAPIAIFPLVAATSRIGGVRLRSLQFPSDDHFPFCDLVFEQAAENRGLVTDLIAHLRHEASLRWDVLALDNVLEDSAAWHSLRESPPARLVTQPARVVDYLDVMPLEERLASLSKNFRAALRKSRNKLAQETQVDFVRATAPEDVAAAVEQFFTVEASGWKGTAGSAIRSDARLTAFYRAVVAGFATMRRAEINLLLVDGRCIAAQMCLRVDRCLYILKIGYDEAHSKLAPGNRLLEHVLERCALDHDVDAVNLISDASWHADWKPKSLPRHRALVFNHTILGRTACAVLKAKQYARPWYRKYVRSSATPTMREGQAQ